MATLSVVIPTMKGREEMLKRLIYTIPIRYEIIVVDDDDLLLAAKRNKGARQAHGEYILFIDDDNFIASGAIESALELVSRPGVGVVGFMALYDDQQNLVADGGSMRNYLTGFTRGVNTNAFYPTLSKEPYEVDEIANAFMMHTELFYDLYGFDEKNFPIDLDEADFCKRAKNMGLKIMMNPASVCYHKSQTYSAIPDFRRPMNAYFMGRNRIIYQQKHSGGFHENNRPCCQRGCFNALSYCVYLVFFLPLFVGFYTASLVWRRKFQLIPHFYMGVIDGLLGRRKNKYQKR